MIEKFKTLFFVKSSLVSLYLALTIPIPFVTIDRLKIPSIITFFLGLYFLSLSKKKFLGSENKRFALFSFNKMLFENKKFSFFMLVGSTLLILPGYISDIIGILLMIKPIQTIIIKHIITSFITPSEKNIFYSNDNSETIEGEFYDLHNDKSNISKK